VSVGGDVDVEDDGVGVSGEDVGVVVTLAQALKANAKANVKANRPTGRNQRMLCTPP
jgi:hypothetical protein